MHCVFFPPQGQTAKPSYIRAVHIKSTWGNLALQYYETLSRAQIIGRIKMTTEKQNGCFDYPKFHPLPSSSLF